MIPRDYENYEKTVTISVVNFGTVWGNKEANLDKIKELVTQASQLGANIIAFPELALSGSECGEEARRDQKSCSMHTRLAETIPGPSTETVARLAKELNVYVVFGMPEQDEHTPAVHYNSVAVVGPEGILGKCRKLHLAALPIWSEDVCFQRGNELPLFKTRYGPIGVQICQDFWSFPELSRILWLRGARLILNCSASHSGPGMPEFMTHATACRAGENLVFTASANLVGKERTLSYYGHSTIAGPAFPLFAQVFAQGEDSEEIVTATLNFERLHYIWNLVDLKKIHDSELIANEFNKIARRQETD